MIGRRIAAAIAALLLALSMMLVSGCSAKVTDDYQSDTFQLGESGMGY